MTICERMFVEINQKNISQKQFAINIGSTEKTVSAWKKRNSDPPACLIPAIADELNITIDYLLTGKGKKSAPELTEEERKYLELYNRLSPFDKGRIIDRMETMYEAYTPEEKEKRSG